MTYPLSYWADIVAELANRRLRLWHDRLGRDVEYNISDLRRLAEAIHRAEVVLDLEAARTMVEKGLLYIEYPWQVEWNVRKSRGGRA